MSSKKHHNPSNYKPVGVWSGRLIFHRDARLDNGSVWMEVHNAPAEHHDFIGSQVILGFALENDKELQDYVNFLTTDVTFLEEAINSSKSGRIHPERLNGLKKVGPLESLAAARPDNDIHVVLQGTITVQKEKNTVLVSKPPAQIRGQKRCLATFLGKSASDELYEIKHYNPNTQAFDGQTEIVKIPIFPKNNRGISVSTANEIELSPVNGYGWYLYGHYDEETKVFVVEAWEPRRALMVSNLDYAVGSREADLHAISNRVWRGARYKKGLIETTLLDPTAKPTMNKKLANIDWKEGDRFLVIHLFGGIGGKLVNEENVFGIIPGHFAFGDATIVKDDFVDELQFRIIYRQIYAHNNAGIISGPNMWSSYVGDLQRGWLGTRPISDIIVKFDAMTKVYDFGDGITVCPLDELIRELNEMGARYRTGDGDGSALVSSAHSCVQDSNQALYAALEETYRRFKDNPKIQQWKKAHPNDPQAEALMELSKMHQELTEYLVPFGIRKDWKETSKGLRGTETQTAWITLAETIRGWKTVVPRRAHDRLAEFFLEHGAKLWFIRTNQVGGNDPNIIPLAPARAFDYNDNRKDSTREPTGASSSFCCCSIG